MTEKEAKQTRMQLWGLASQIVGLDFNQLKELEEQLYQGHATNTYDTAMIKISRLARDMHQELKAIETKMSEL